MQYFVEQIIQPALKKRFSNSIAQNRLAHAFLFYGPEGSGKEAIALEIAKAVNCLDNQKKPCNQCTSCLKIAQFNHPDVKFIMPEAKTWKPQDVQKIYQIKEKNPFRKIDYSGTTSISIEKIRDLKSEAKYTPYEGIKKVYILTEVVRMTRESANSFLKLLEEPPENLLIILINPSLSDILDTIKSRCQIVYFPPLQTEEAIKVVSRYHQVNEDIKTKIRIAQGNLKQIFEMLDQEVDQRRVVIYDYLKATARGNALELNQAIESITQRKDKNFLLDFLNLLILWFKDTVHIITSGEISQVVNIDFLEEINRFAENYYESDFDCIIQEIEKSILQVQSNVYAPLILTVLGIRIKKHLHRQQLKPE